jgi:hypothetical protein
MKPRYAVVLRPRHSDVTYQVIIPYARSTDGRWFGKAISKAHFSLSSALGYVAYLLKEHRK